jgi:hypothetical protein
MYYEWTPVKDSPIPNNVALWTVMTIEDSIVRVLLNELGESRF